MQFLLASTSISSRFGNFSVLNRAKRSLGLISPQAFIHLRGRNNSFENFGKGPVNAITCQRYVNRSAMKLVNLDYLFEFIYENGGEDVPKGNDGFFSFADLCGGPGGFSEFVMLRCMEWKIRARGFGISIACQGKNSSCNWKLGHLENSVCEVHTVSSGRDISSICDGNHPPPRKMYIVQGVTGNGDICVRENVEALGECVEKVLSSSGSSSINDTHHNSKKVGTEEEDEKEAFAHLVDCVFSDGGFDTLSEEGAMEGADADTGCDIGSSSTLEYLRDIQEIMSLPLLLCECIAMLRTLRSGGSFLLKLFSTYERATSELIFLLGCLFESLIVVKPVTSRPANSERYLVCRSLRTLSSLSRRALIDKLWGVAIEARTHTSTNTLGGLFAEDALDVLQRPFYTCTMEYVKESSEQLELLQLHALGNILRDALREGDSGIQSSGNTVFARATVPVAVARLYGCGVGVEGREEVEVETKHVLKSVLDEILDVNVPVRWFEELKRRYKIEKHVSLERMYDSDGEPNRKKQRDELYDGYDPSYGPSNSCDSGFDSEEATACYKVSDLLSDWFCGSRTGDFVFPAEYFDMWLISQ